MEKAKTPQHDSEGAKAEAGEGGGENEEKEEDKAPKTVCVMEYYT